MFEVVFCYANIVLVLKLSDTFPCYDETYFLSVWSEGIAQKEYCKCLRFCLFLRRNEVAT